MKEMTNYFNFILFWTFINSTISIGVMLTLIVENMINNHAMAIICCSSCFFHAAMVFIYCYYGENLTLKTLNIAVAAYNSKWYIATYRAMRGCRLLIFYSQQEIYFSGYGLIFCSMKTFYGVIGELINELAKFLTLNYFLAFSDSKNGLCYLFYFEKIIEFSRKDFNHKFNDKSAQIK